MAAASSGDAQARWLRKNMVTNRSARFGCSDRVIAVAGSVEPGDVELREVVRASSTSSTSLAVKGQRSPRWFH